VFLWVPQFLTALLYITFKNRTTVGDVRFKFWLGSHLTVTTCHNQSALLTV